MTGKWVKRFPDGSEHNPNCQCSKCISNRNSSKNVFIPENGRKSTKNFYEAFPTLKGCPPGCCCRKCILKRR